MELLKEFAPRNLDAQSLSVQSSPGELIYRNGQLPDRLIETAYPDANTLYALFRRSVRMYPNRNFLGQRPVIEGAPTTTTTAGTAAPAQTRGPYVWETFKQVSERVNNFGSALVSFGCKPGDKIGIYSKNKPEWIVTTEACNSHSLVAVAIYDTFGPDIIEYVINHAELKGIVVSSDCISKVTSLLGKCPTVKFVIQMEPKNPTDDAKYAETCAKNNIIFSLFKDAEAKGKENPAPHTPPKPDTLAVLMYTSGTTALPKGVMHKHSNLVATAAGVAATLGGITHEDTYISYLPLAHILEREAIIAMTGAGAAVGFYQGDITKLTEDIQALKPTLMCGVPRVFDRIHSKVKERIASGSWVSRWMFDYAYSVKKDAASKGLGTPILDYLVFSKLKGALGGNMRLICSGGAPLSAATQEFIKLCFCCPIVQGYGLTETCAAGCVTLPDDPTLGHTGPPIACAELKLVDVPEMNYLTSSNPPTGEVCIRGPCVSSGYYKDPEKTAQEFESTGWFHTGDIGRMNPNGTLSIIDRKKNIFKLAQGEYVAAEKLELVYNQSKLVVSTFVYGDSLQSVLVAIIVPNRNSLEAWAATNNIKYEGGWEGLCAHPEAKKAILADLSQLAKKNNLMGFEAIKAVYLHPNEFTIDEDFITPTMKLKRPQLKKAFQSKIDAMYAELSTAAMSIGN